MNKVFIVKEAIICTNDGTFENNILGVFINLDSAKKVLSERTNELLKEYEDLATKDCIKNISTDYFSIQFNECWYEFYIELGIEEKIINN